MEKIKNRGDFLQGLIDGIPSLLFIVDEDVRILHMNAAAAKVTGVHKEAVLLKRGGEVLHCVYAEEVPEGCGRSPHCGDCVVRNAVGKACHGEPVFRAKADMQLLKESRCEDVSFMITANSLACGEGRVVLLAMEDITRQEQAEETLNRAKELLEHQATTDPLTGIYNRQKFNDILNREINRSRRHHILLSLVMFDIDQFKAINDAFGHHVGDSVLKELTGLITGELRGYDHFARWGGEEFMILLTHNGLGMARHLAEKFRSKVEEHQFSGAGRVTCSFGVTQLLATDDLFEFTRRVDDALRMAKASGRNRVETG